MKLILTEKEFETLRKALNYVINTTESPDEWTENVRLLREKILNK